VGDLPLPALATYATLVAVAVAAEAARRKRWFGVAKPAATLALLAVLGWPPEGALGVLVTVGILLSLGGDVALLSKSRQAFLVGLGLFLLAHVCYAAGFARHGHVSAVPAAAGVAFAAFALLFVRILWPGIEGLRAPVIAYAAGITVMVTTAVATLGGSLRGAPLLAAGAVLFFASDTNLGWNRFRKSYPRHNTVTLILYWAGQLGIVLAARWGA